MAPMTDAQIEVHAHGIAISAHALQLDKQGAPYLRHVERVVGRVDGWEARTVAWLHDVIEDNPAWTFDRLEAEGIPARLIRPVSLLTRGAPYSYEDYIEDIATAAEPLAIAVKIADLIDHLHPNCPTSLKPRYENALYRLAKAVGEVGAPQPPARYYTEFHATEIVRVDRIVNENEVRASAGDSILEVMSRPGWASQVTEQDLEKEPKA